MALNQISIFVENQLGRLAEITTFLEENGIDIRAVSIADTTDYGILRLIVNDPEKAESALRNNGFTVSITKVLGIGIEDVPGGFAKAVRALSEAQISLEYAYAFVTPEKGKASVILRVEDNDKGAEALKNAGIVLLEQSDIVM